MAGHFFTTIENVITGKPVANATMLVYVAGATIVGDGITSGTLATIFSDDGITEVDQSATPITSDSRGFIEFWANETSVAIEISYDGSARKAISDVEIVGGNVSGDVTALAVRVSALEAFDATLGTIATQDADGVAITGGSIAGITDLAVADGGTGASDAAGARTNLEAAGSGDATASGLTMTTARLLGRTTASTGPVEEISVGNGLVLSAGVLDSAADSLFTLADLNEGGTAAANAAVVQGLVDGGTTNILLPKGTFTIDPINLASGVHLKGAGIGNTILTLGARTITDVDEWGGAINVHGSSGTHIIGVVLEDFTVDGNKANITVAGTTDGLDIECIDYRYADNCYANRVRVINAKADGFDFDNSTNCVVTNCEAEDCDGWGFHFSTSSTRMTTSNCVADTCGATHSRGGFDVHASATQCKHIGGRAYTCYRGFYLEGDDNEIIGCLADGCTQNGLRIDGADDNTISTSHFVNTTAGNGVTITGSSVRNTLLGCHLDGNSGNGLTIVAGSDRNIVTGCKATGNTGNGFATAGNSGIVTSCVVIGNTAGQLANTGTSNQVANNITA